jgi:hypothetical protein
MIDQNNSAEIIAEIAEGYMRVCKRVAEFVSFNGIQKGVHDLDQLATVVADIIGDEVKKSIISDEYKSARENVIQYQLSDAYMVTVIGVACVGRVFEWRRANGV